MYTGIPSLGFEEMSAPELLCIYNRVEVFFKPCSLWDQPSGDDKS